MKQLMLLYGLLFSSLLQAQTLTISPAKPVARQRETLQFTANKPVTWSLAPGSVGSINASGTYSAPATVVVNQKAGPCQLLPPDHIYNTRIDNLPVHSSNSSLIAMFTGGFANQRVSFSPSFGTNYITNSTPTTPMAFVYTPNNNGPFQIPTWPLFPDLKIESGVFVRPFQAPGASSFDRHLIAVNRDTCEFSDLYNAYNVGDNPIQCATCNAQSGVRYQGIEFTLPTTGATDAAGMAQQPVSLRLSDVLSGEVKHALRFTLPNVFIKPSYIWPATANAYPYCAGSTCWEYGMYVRLKSSFDVSGFSPAAQIVLQGLKRYGMILSDGGATWDIQTNTDVMLDPQVRSAMAELSGVIGKDSLEVVDTSSLRIAADSGAVSLTNGFTTPSQFAEVIATDSNNNTAKVRIALQGVTIGVPEEVMTIAAGHQMQFTAWVKGTNNETVTWSMSPEVGTLTPEGLYTAPGSVNAPTSFTVTATSTFEPTARAVIQVTVWPFDDQSIRIEVGGSSDYTDSNGKVWYRDALSQFEAGLSGIWNDPGGWPANTPNYYFQQRYHYADSTYKWRMPNGNYKVTLHMGVGFGSGPLPETDYQCHLESQGQLARRYFSIAKATGGQRRIPGSVSIPMQVTDGTGYFSQRHLDGPNGFCSVAAIQVEADTSDPHLEIDAPVTGNITIGQTRQFYVVGWYMPTSVDWAVVTGPGTIDSNGVYSAPANPPATPTTIKVRATSTVDNSKFVEIEFQFVFGTIVISPQNSSLPRGLTQQFTASIGGVPYNNVIWSINSQLGSVGVNGLFLAPATLGANSTLTVTATSLDDPSQSGSTNLTLLRSINPIRVNCGGTLTSQGFTDNQGRTWAVDYGYSTPSQSYSDGVVIKNTTPDIYSLYQSSRYRYRGETFSYSFPAPVGIYRVTLKWAEHRATNQNMKMDVRIEGTTVLTNFDPVAAAGGLNTAYDRTFTVPVIDGEINLTFIGKPDAGDVGASINGIEIMEETPLGDVNIRGNANIRNVRLK